MSECVRKNCETLGEYLARLVAERRAGRRLTVHDEAATRQVGFIVNATGELVSVGIKALKAPTLGEEGEAALQALGLSAHEALTMIQTPSGRDALCTRDILSEG